MKSLSIYCLVNVLAFLCFVTLCFVIHPLQIQSQMGLVATKPVFGVADKAGLKPVSLVTETS